MPHLSLSHRGVVRTVLAATAAVAALAVNVSNAWAYPPPAAAGSVSQGCSSVSSGNGCTLTFHFVDGSGNPVTGAPVTFTVTGISTATVNPTSGVTDPGDVSTTFSAGSGCGTATVTATSATASVQSTVSVVCAASTAPLPNTSTGGPSATPWAVGGALACGLILVVAGVGLTRSRRSTA